MPRFTVSWKALLALTGLFPGPLLLAQGLTNAGQLIYVSNDTPVTIQGNMDNEGTLINFGTMTVSGDWSNRSSYNEGTGEVVLDGENTQRINHRGQSFYHLTMNGSGEKIFSEDASITGRLLLTKGLLTPANNSKILIAQTGKAEGGSAASFVNGRLFQEGTGSKFFPIGKGNQFAPVSLVDITGIEPVVGFEVFEPNSNSNRAQGLKWVSPTRYWQKTMLGGSFSQAYIQLSFDTEDQIPTMDSVVVAEANSLNSSFRNIGQQSYSGDLTNGLVLSKQSITGSIFAVGVGADVVSMASKIYIPNAFSPLSSHPEEKFLKVYGALAPQDFLFRIYNRWGGLVFESRSLYEMQNQGWNGLNRTSGQEEALGVYTYTVQGKYEDGQSFKRAGTINLVR